MSDKNRTKILEGLKKCDVCGEYRGQVEVKDLKWTGMRTRSEKYITVSCLCDGFVCRKCGKNRVHRPISNNYHEETNRIEYWPWFTGMMSCSKCREKENWE